MTERKSQGSQVDRRRFLRDTWRGGIVLWTRLAPEPADPSSLGRRC
jgi:hypothetical protein